MILEHARLTVHEDRQADFETAFARAKEIVAEADGFRGLELWHSIEEPTVYRLLIRWDSVEHHTVGFRGSTRFAEWVELLGGFYAAPASVTHGRLVGSR